MIEYYKENLEEHNANEEHLEYHTKESVVNLYKDLLRLTNELIKGSGTSEDVGKVYIVEEFYEGALEAFDNLPEAQKFLNHLGGVYRDCLSILVMDIHSKSDDCIDDYKDM